MEVVVSVANKERDLRRIQQFADEAGVSSEGIYDSTTQFLIMTTTSGQVIATLGIETIDEYAFLRTLIADSKQCTSQKLFHLFDVAIGTARTQGKKSVYFFTPADPRMFQPLGFSEVSHEALPEKLFQSSHFSRTMKSDKANLLISQL